MDYEAVVLDEAALVEEEIEPLAGGELAAFVLLRDALLPPPCSASACRRWRSSRRFRGSGMGRNIAGAEPRRREAREERERMRIVSFWYVSRRWDVYCGGMAIDLVQKSDLADRLSHQVIGAAIEVHRSLGPGLLESAYATCLGHELSLRRLEHQREVALPVFYKGVRLPCSYRADFLIEGVLLVEVKAVEEVTAIHLAQVLTYLRLLRLPLALLMNFNVPVLGRGIRRIVNQHRPTKDKVFGPFAPFASSR